MRKGELSEDFESAFERALDMAVESIARSMGLGTQVLGTNPYAVLEDQGDEEAAKAPENFKNGSVKALGCLTKTREEPKIEDLTSSTIPNATAPVNTINQGDAISSTGKLRIIFWNANGWEQRSM